jgi:hypothetical protein
MQYSHPRVGQLGGLLPLICEADGIGGGDGSVRTNALTRCGVSRGKFMADCHPLSQQLHIWTSSPFPSPTLD